MKLEDAVQELRSEISREVPLSLYVESVSIEALQTVLDAIDGIAVLQHPVGENADLELAQRAREQAGDCPCPFHRARAQLMRELADAIDRLVEEARVLRLKSS
jgi:hypothetical protein